MPEAWSVLEVEAAVADYLDMLAKELQRVPYNKAEHNRHLQQCAQNRPKGSIERKHQNISAILISLGFPYINGYKPLGNYQQLLRDVVQERLASADTLRRTVQSVVEEPIIATPDIGDLLGMKVQAPSRQPSDSSVQERWEHPKPTGIRNYLELEARNRSLGLKGEELVIQFEQQRLWSAGQKRLAERIEHVSATRGDGFGYDIHSFEEDGRDRLIEVKTTRFGALTPFFVSCNEVNVSVERHDEYQLYRLYSFTEQPKLFVLGGSLRTTCELEAASFSALPK
jgi:hypothetical protein